MRVALAQVAPSLGDLKANLEMHREVALEAARAGADLVVFPELSLTGYLLQDLVSEVALNPATAPEIRELRRLSHKVALAVGFVEESSDHRFYNAALFLANGKICHRHRKVYLPTYGMFDEGRDFASGNRFAAFDTPLGRFGLLICEDAWHLSASLLLAQDRADYLLVLSSGPGRGIGSGHELASISCWMDLGRATARFQTLFVIYVNRVGVEDGLHFSGGSFVLDPSGELLGQAPGLKERIELVSLPRSSLRRTRTAFPLLGDERNDISIRELERLGQLKPIPPGKSRRENPSPPTRTRPRLAQKRPR